MISRKNIERKSAFKEIGDTFYEEFYDKLLFGHCNNCYDGEKLVLIDQEKTYF